MKKTLKDCVFYDNGGRSIDRYTVVYLFDPQISFTNTKLYGCRGMSMHPTHPQGVGMYSTAQRGRHLGKRIEFKQLPVDCQQLVLRDLE